MIKTTIATTIRHHLWYILPLDKLVIETFKLNTLASDFLCYMKGAI